MKNENKWALILGIINLLYFFISAFTGFDVIDNEIMLVIGLNLLIYYFLKMKWK